MVPDRLTGFPAVLAAVEALVPPTGRRLLGLAGPPGAGKSTLAERLVAAIGPVSVVVPLDGFHLPRDALAGRGLANVKGAPETFDRAGFAALLGRLISRDRVDPLPVLAPRFHREIEEPVADEIVVTPGVRLVVAEGNYLLTWPEVRALFDEVWYVEASSERRRVDELVARHVRFGRSPAQARAWVLRSDEANARLVAEGRSGADRVVCVW